MRCGERATRTTAYNIASRPAVVFRPLSFHAPSACSDALRKDERSFNVMPWFGGYRCLSTSKVCRASTVRPLAKLRADWSGASSARVGTTSCGLSVAGLGYGTPYLERFRDGARRCLALMPAEQGVVVWPGEGRCSATLVDVQMLPLPDGAIDRLLLAHALEAADRPDALLEELWRITAPEGRVIVIVPSRRGVWARADSTPYGQGLPYSKSQLRDLLHRAEFSPIFWGEALYAPPVGQALRDPLRADDRAGWRRAWTSLCRRPHRRGDQAGLSSGRRPGGRPGAIGSSQTRSRVERSPTILSEMTAGIFSVGAADCPCLYSRPWTLQQGEIPCPTSIVSSSCCAMARANGI